MEFNLEIVIVNLDKGDIVIWYFLLLYFGGKIIKEGVIRYLIVFYIVFEGVLVYRFNVFFNFYVWFLILRFRFFYLSLEYKRVMVDFGNCKLRNK